MSIKYTLAKNLKSRYIFFKIWLLWINQINKTKRAVSKIRDGLFFAHKGMGWPRMHELVSRKARKGARTQWFLPLRREGTKIHKVNNSDCSPLIRRLPPLGDLGVPHFLIPYFYFLIIYSRSFLFMRDRQFNNRIPYFTPRCRGRLFYIGYSTFYIPSSFLSQKNLPEKFIPLNLLKYLAI